MASKSSVFTIRLQVALHDNQAIRAVYGVKAKDQSATGLCHLLQETWFETEVITNQKHWFLIKAKKVA